VTARDLPLRGQLEPPATGDDWVGLTTDVLPVDAALSWSQLPSCGAQVVFCGTVRDHADGRTDVVALEYEAYDTQVQPRLEALAADVRARWPMTGRIAMLHRVGRLALTEVSVVVVVSSPHRGEAFDAARYAIDTLKATMPIWKKELWSGGEDWATGATPVREVEAR
jgi:molybdopterin synthase catalytic subunit